MKVKKFLVLNGLWLLIGLGLCIFWLETTHEGTATGITLVMLLGNVLWYGGELIASVIKRVRAGV